MKFITKLTLPISIAPESLTPKETIILSIIVQKIQREYRKLNKGDRLNPYVELPSSTLRCIAGGDYKTFINNLISLGHISPYQCKKTGNQSYMTSLYAKNCGKEVFYKKYKLSLSLQKEVLRKQVTLIALPRLAKKASSFKETAILDCPATRKIAENYKKVVVDDPHNLTVMESINLQGIMHGIHNTKRTASGRLSHRLVISYSKESRKRISVEGEKLVQADISRCHLYLMADFITDPQEKLRWLSFCQNDPYLAFCGGSKAKREAMKKKLGQALSTKRKGKDATGIIELIRDEFPALFSWIQSVHEERKTTPQAILQKLESEIVEPAFMSATFWCLPINDCLLCKTSDKANAIGLLKKSIFERLGYDIPVGI